MVLRNLCVYGGTFDPIHFGHLILANYIKEELDVDKFIFIPSFLPPHKTNKTHTPFDHRLKMLELAIGNSDDFLISDIEYKRKGLSYSHITIDELREHYSPENLYFLIGGDSLRDLHQWKNPEKIMNTAKIVVVGRPGSDYSEVDQNILNKVKIIKSPLIEISSTDIRSRIKTGKSIKYMVPEIVEKYIIENGLYL